MWQININTQAFELAKDNMHVDLDTCINLNEKSRSFRCYIWKKPSITYGYNQNLPEEFTQLDTAKRPTGGGIVFHSPGDMVLSISGLLKDPWYPYKIKDLNWLKTFLFKQFEKCNIVLFSNTQTGSKKHEFCSHYNNPYEGYLNQQKILGIAVRRFRDRFLIQCILHLNNSHEAFNIDKCYQPHMSKGLEDKQLLKLYQNQLMQSIYILSKSQETPWS